jgi:hypothetical protein
VSYDAWVARVSVALATLAAFMVACRQTLRVLRGTFRVFAVILGQGAPGDPDYQPSLQLVLQDHTDALRLLRADLDAARGQR